MSTHQQSPPHPSLHPATTVGHVALTVADLKRSIDFYSENIGLRVLEQSASSALLGVADEPLLMLEEQPGARAWPRDGRSFTGLYHFAILVPTRVDLGRWLAHWLKQDMPQPGQADHFVSEAFYLEDPDGHGIEIYRDRPRDEWQWENGSVRMGADPIDIRSLLEEAQRSADPWTNMPVGTRIGHIHLQVRDIEETAAFYRDLLGFDIVARMPSALFMSAGGYHHHIGSNVWHSRGAEQAPSGYVNLQHYTILVPSEEARDQIAQRLSAANVALETSNGAVAVQDPSEIELRIEVDSQLSIQ
jgi:catechol 2,3-dioxygenase